jgi:hypothetical protein
VAVFWRRIYDNNTVQYSTAQDSTVRYWYRGLYGVTQDGEVLSSEEAFRGASAGRHP